MFRQLTGSGNRIFLIHGLTNMHLGLCQEVFYLVSVRAACADGTQVFVSGTLMGIKQTQKIVAIDKLDLDLKPTNNLLFLRYMDRPGVVGVVGNALGKLQINIADMQVGRTQEGGQALMALTVDSVIPKETIDVITKETGAALVRFVSLVNE